MSGIVGLRGWRKALGLLRLPMALFQAMGIIRRFRPDVVVGAGGFASGPTVLAAWLLRVPTAILEQNAMPGVTNRILGRLVRRVFTHFSECESWFATGKVRRFGNPVRAAQLASLQEHTDQSTHDRIRLLIMGGSQGSKALNDGLPPAIAGLDTDQRQQIEVVHQCGRQGDVQAITDHYTKAGVRAEVIEFMTDMSARYAWADLCVCRSGAMTVTEMAIAGKPAIFVPFPQATHDHQTHNALELVHEKAALLIPQKELNSSLGQTLVDLLRDPAILREMGQAARSVAKPQAARKIVGELADLCGVGSDIVWA